jgi:ubiquitin-protein ligase
LECPDISDLSSLIGQFPGPSDTPYEGGIFRVGIQICADYPFQPPKMKFLTSVYHPNISSQTGAICLDILKKEWSPAIQLEKVLISLQQLLENPQADDPQDAEVATLFINDWDGYFSTARDWSIRYAHAPRQLVVKKVCPVAMLNALRRSESNGPTPYDSLLEMGFSMDDARDAWEQSGHDIEHAAYLLTENDAML